MWDGLVVLVLLCIVMASASFLVGSLPLSLSLSARQLRLLTALGTGILVGTALIVIIPEGIEALYGAQGSSHSHAERALSLEDRSVTLGSVLGEAFGVDRREAVAFPEAIAASATVAADARISSITGDSHGSQKLPRPNAADVKYHSPKSGAQYDAEDDDDDDDHDEEHHARPAVARDPHAYVGISVILGFILMYLIDNLPRHVSQSSQPRRFQINLTSLSFNRTPSAPNEGVDSSINDEGAEPRTSSTTVGLVIHAVADGIALGASSTSKGSLGFIVFIALMVHKAPAAFGLTSALLKEGLSKRAARAHLIVFSLAAPVGALVTWAAANILGYGSLAGGAGTEFVTGMLLLFSGGTFLYVAMHTMQEGAHDPADSHSNGYAEVPMGVYEAPQAKSAAADGFTSVIVTVVGMLLPLLTQWGHVH